MEPEPSTGVSWRPVTFDDLGALELLHHEYEETHAIPYRTSRKELEHRLADPQLDPKSHTRVAVTAEGRAVAAVWVFVGAANAVKHRAVLVTLAVADHADLEETAINWGERVARAEFSQRDDDLPRVVRAFAEAHEDQRIAAYKNQGFAVVRYFVDMIRPLDDAIPDPVVPADVTIEQWSERWLESAHSAHVEAFADHWGSVPPTLEDFRHWVTAPNFRATLSYVAVANGEVVSYALNGVYPEDFATRGRREGWIDTLGTRRAWRGRGLASALITRSMQAFAADDLDHAALGVDTANPTGAFGVYAALGFTEVTQSLSLAKDIGP